MFTEKHQKVREILRRNGFHSVAGCNGPGAGIDRVPSRLEFWTKPGCTVICQHWMEGGGTTTYSDKGMGNTYEDLEKFLKT